MIRSHFWDTYFVPVRRDLTKPRRRACPAVLRVCEWDGGTCANAGICRAPKVSSTTAEASSEIYHIPWRCALRLVALSVSLLIPFVICQTGMSEAHSDPARCTLFLPSLVTTFANFRRSAHLAGLQRLA